MGNRAVIKGKGTVLGVYVHWNGGYDSVLAFTQYCKLKGYRSPESDDYGVARLCQVIGNFFGGESSVGVWAMPNERELTPEKVSDMCLDNGVSEIENWEIVAHWNDELIPLEREYHEGYDLNEFLCGIDECMPVREQLGKDYILADIVPVEDLKVGDKVYIQEWDGKVSVHTILGFGIHRNHTKIEPYVDLYDHEGDWTWNSNNFITDKYVRKVKETTNGN